MKPLDDPAGETTSTGAGRVRGPAARSPVRRAARPGGPGTVHSDPVPGGETSAPSSRERAVARKPDPATGTADGDQSAVPGRGQAQGPARGERGSRAADDRSSLAGSTGLSGKEGLDAWRRAESAHKAGKRRARFKAAPGQVGPGMIRRAPQGGPDGAA
jgi:hypothetical protein